MNHNVKLKTTRPLLILALLVLAAGIVAAGWLLYRGQRESCRRETLAQLSSVADLKVSEIELWRKERLADARIFYKNSVFSALVQRCVERPEDSSLQEELRTWLGHLQTSSQFDQVTLLDAACGKWMSVPEVKHPHSALTLKQARESMRSGQMIFTDFNLDEYTKKVYLRLFVPILDESLAGRPLGVLRLRIDPEVYLYPFIQRWPTPSKTAETLLVRREGDEAVFLNELRFQTDTAMALRVPLDRTDRLAAKAVLGQEGIAEGMDYREVPALAAVRAVPDSPWILIAKMDAAEAYAPMRERLWLIALFVSLLLSILAAAVGLLWRQQHAALYRQKYEAEHRHRDEKSELERNQQLSTEVLGVLNDSPSLSDAINRILAAIQRVTSLDAVGIRLKHGDDDSNLSQGGFSSDFLLAERTSIVHSPDGGPCKDKDGNINSLVCTCGLVLSGKTDPTNPLFTPGGSFWTNDSLPLLSLPAERDARLRPRNRCIHKGFPSVALVPIRANQKIVGLLQLNDRKKDFFTLEMIQFFEGISASIGVALMRRQMEEYLRTSEARLQCITDSAQDAILMMNPQGNITYWNPAAESMLGYRSEEAIGKDLHILLAPERYLEVHRAAMPEFIRTGRGNAIGKTVELEARRKDGQEIAIALSLSSVSLGGEWHAVGIVRDVTNRKLAEEALQKAHDELELRVQQRTAELTLANLNLEQSRDAAQAANRAKTAFLNHMSHEMHTPLHAILGMTELLLLDPLSPEQQEYLANVQISGKALLTMVDEILDLSRIEAGMLSLIPEAFNLRARCEDAIKPYAVKSQSRGLQFSWHIQPGVPRTVLGDPQRLRQILASLLNNAIQYTEKGRVAVEVTTESVSGESAVLHFAVSDTGIGIPQDRQSAIFEMFEQGDTSLSRSYGGAGMGLAIASRLVKLMGGRIWLESEPGRGSCFHFTVRLGVVPEFEGRQS